MQNIIRMRYIVINTFEIMGKILKPFKISNEKKNSLLLRIQLVDPKQGNLNKSFIYALFIICYLPIELINNLVRLYEQFMNTFETYTCNKIAKNYKLTNVKHN